LLLLYLVYVILIVDLLCCAVSHNEMFLLLHWKKFIFSFSIFSEFCSLKIVWTLIVSLMNFSYELLGRGRVELITSVCWSVIIRLLFYFRRNAEIKENQSIDQIVKDFIVSTVVLSFFFFFYFCELCSFSILYNILFENGT